MLLAIACMTRQRQSYAILLAILLLILITGGIPQGIILDAHDNLGYADGSKSEKIFLIYNFVTILE